MILNRIIFSCRVSKTVLGDWRIGRWSGAGRKCKHIVLQYWETKAKLSSGLIITIYLTVNANKRA